MLVISCGEHIFVKYLLIMGLSALRNFEVNKGAYIYCLCNIYCQLLMGSILINLLLSPLLNTK